MFNDDNIELIEGKRYLNQNAGLEFFRIYSDKIRIPEEYAKMVMEKYPITKEKISNDEQVLDRETTLGLPVNEKKTEDNVTSLGLPDEVYDQSQEKPHYQNRNPFINVSDFLSQSNNSDNSEIIGVDFEDVYTDEEQKVIDYFSDKKDVDLLLIPSILKCKVEIAELVKYGKLLDNRFDWFTFDEQQFKEHCKRLQLQNNDLLKFISSAPSLESVLEILTLYKEYGKDDYPKEDVLNTIIDYIKFTNQTEKEINLFIEGLTSDVYLGDYLKESLDNPINIDENIKEYIQQSLEKAKLLNNLPDMSKVEFTIYFIRTIYSNVEVLDNSLLLPTLHQFLANQEPYYIKDEDIDIAYNEIKQGLENKKEQDIKYFISSILNSKTTYNELLMIYNNVSDEVWLKYEKEILDDVKGKICYWGRLMVSAPEQQQRIKLLDEIFFNIYYFSREKKTETFDKLAEELNVSAPELEDIMYRYQDGNGNLSEDFNDIIYNNNDNIDNKDTFKIKKRRKPKKKDIKKIIYGTLAGVGVISCLYLTFVLEKSPISVIKNCASTFSGLFKGNKSLANLADSLGNLTVYFGSAILSCYSGFKLSKRLENDNSFDEEQLNEMLQNEIEEQNQFSDDSEDYIDFTADNDQESYGRKR